MKRHIFSTLAVFFAMTISGCSLLPDETGNSSGADDSKTSEVASDHKHKYGEWTVVTEPTCTEKGSQERVCDCGDTQTKDIDALGHDWDEGEVTKTATCSVPGEKTFHCKRAGCTATKVEEIKAEHVWDAGTAVEGEATEASYTLFTCTVCNTAKKIEIAAKQASGKYTLNGSLKSDSQFPDYLKLSSNGNSATYSFTSSVAGNAKIYMRGVMDYWHDGSNENQARNFFAGKNSSDGNFELKVNDTAVDYSWSRDITYEEMLPGEAQGSYSPLGDALVGDCAIVNGANTIVFTRVDSYNMLIKDFVIIIG